MRIPLFAAGVALVVVGLLWLVDSTVHNGEILTGVSAGDVEISGDSPGDARATLSTVAAEREARPVTFRVDDTTGEVTPETMGVTLDTEATAAAALGVGRTGNPLRRFVEWARARTTGIAVPVETEVDPEAFATWLGSVAFPAKAAPVEPVVEFEGTKPVLTQGVPGTSIDAELAESRLRHASVDADPGAVHLRTIEVPPRYTDIEASDVAAAAGSTLLSAPLEVVLDTSRTTVEPAELGPLLRSTPDADAYRFVVSRDAALALLRPRFADVGTPPVDAKFVVNGGTSVEIVKGRLGVGCCGPDTETLLLDAMEQSDPAARVATLPKGEVPPDITSDDLEALHVTSKLAEFTTMHAAGQPRVHNIHMIADMVQATVVMPGEQYSVNRTIGSRTEEKGWVNAPTIVEGEMSQTPGGGISQFATTLYNAVYFAGIQIDEHKPHTKYIDRYPLGREATLGYPSPDLVFTNDMPSAILIWTSYNDTSITVSIWGTPDGRKATASEPEVRAEGECEIVKVTRTVTYANGSTKTEPYTQKYCP
ncbi:MAG: VanW family protein [Acidimicrobiia bacterium]|nr:VanW family protein [Acidimicrobiia bacterium]